MDTSPARSDFSYGSTPRQGEFADKPGRYEPAIRLQKPVINPGDTLEVEVFITGYGNIGPAKLAFYPSPGTFVERDSRGRISLELVDGVPTWAGPHGMVGDTGVMVTMQEGLQGEGWSAPTLFFDTTAGRPPQIMTETKHLNAPFTFSLVTRPRVSPGTYLLQFYLTYFNGIKWCVSSQQTSFTIRTLLQRHEVAVAVVASIAAAAAVVPSLVDTIAAIQNLLK